MKNLYKIFFCTIAILLLKINSNAQDAIFSQPFLSPIYLNPAATGAGEYDVRFSAIYRRQWWTIPSQMNYMAFSLDKYVPDLSSSFGLLAVHSSEGYLKKAGIYGSYAYTICSGTESVAANGEMPRWSWTGGLQFGLAQRRIDYSKLIFADQIDVNGVIPGSVSSADLPVRNGKLFPDFAAGMFFNYHFNDNSRLLFGLSSHHINRPDESLLSTSDSNRSQLPVRWTTNIMFSHTNDEQTWSYSIAAIGYKQNLSTSYQVGAEVTQNQINISLGLWYRGNVNFTNMNAVSITLSLNLTGRDNDRDKIRAGFAQDAQVGNNGYSYTSGSSELGVVWDHSTYNQEADNPCKPRVSSQSACPIR